MERRLDVSLSLVARMESPQQYHHDAPRQPLGDCPGIVRVAQGFQNLMADLDGFSHIWVVFWCHHARGWNDRVVPPRDTEPRGLFATRAPHRPNPIGISVLEILRIDRRAIHVGAHDLLNDTPILDIKPYVAAYDSVPHAAAGWTARVPEGRPDHRGSRPDR